MSRLPRHPAGRLARTVASVRSLPARLRADHGSMTILTTGVLVVILLVTALGVAITGVHLERNALQSAADSAALAAAQGLDGGQVYVPGDSTPLTVPAAREAAAEHLATYPLDTSRTHDLRIESVTVDGGGTVRVVVTARTDPPLAGWFTRGTGTAIPLAVEGEARAR